MWVTRLEVDAARHFDRAPSEIVDCAPDLIEVAGLSLRVRPGPVRALAEGGPVILARHLKDPRVSARQSVARRDGDLATVRSNSDASVDGGAATSTVGSASRAPVPAL